MISPRSFSLILLGSLLLLNSPLRADDKDQDKDKDAQSKSQEPDADALKPAKEEFAKQRYPAALQLFRAYLRAHPKDQDAWVWLGASYYHTGQAREALATLNKANRPSDELKSLRRYYLALASDALGKTEKAKTLLEPQAQGKDLLAEDALFELAAIHFEDGEADAALKNVADYNKRYPNGRHEKQMKFIADNIAQAGHMEVPGTHRAQYKSTFFESSPLSLVSIPHLWFYELGYDYLRGTRSNPGYRDGLPIVTPNSAYESYQLKTQAGFILGPFKGSGTESHAGYIYSQNWFSDSERMDTYFKDPTDVQYFPFRPDLMERHHRLFVETEGSKGNWTFGGYGHWEYIRAGSNLFPAPERPEIRKSFDLGIRTLVVPWLEYRYGEEQKLRFYLTFEKSLNREQNDFSYKSYNISTSGESPFMSYTLVNENRFSPGLKLSEEVYSHRYLYNDYWESYTETGLGAQLQYRIGSNVHLMVSGQLAQDAFTAKVIRSTACSDTSTTFDDSGFDDGTAVTCPRTDRITKFSAGAGYVSNGQKSIAAIFQYNDRKNDKLIVYNETRVEFLIVFTHAFPTLLGADRYIEPFLDLADQRGVY